MIVTLLDFQSFFLYDQCLIGQLINNSHGILISINSKLLSIH